MKAKKRSGLVTTLLFVLAALLLLGSAVGSSRAVLTYQSEYYQAEVSMQDIGVALLENGLDVAWRVYDHSDDEQYKWDDDNVQGVLLTHMLDAGDGTQETLKPGKAYREELAVRNDGTIDQYVRVTIYHYWADFDSLGNELRRRPDLDPDLIQLTVPARDSSTPTNGWSWDAGSETRERTVLYYQDILPCQNAEQGVGAERTLSPAFTGTLTIAGEGVLASLTRNADTRTETLPDGRTATTYTTTYTYDGARFVLRVDVDAVQTHNARAAMGSAWGLTDAQIDALGINIP